MRSRRAFVAVLGVLVAVTLPAAAQAPSPGAALTEAVLATSEGEIVIRLLPELAPAHVRLFKKTASAGSYDGTIFHRIIMGGMIQGGDPTTKDPQRAASYGKGGLGLLKAEFSDRPFVRGTVAAARQPSSRDSGGTQFFSCLREQPSLKGQYTIFGEVASGMDVVDRISTTPVDDDRPTVRVEIKKVTLRDVPPAS